jgi:hypothetical protein
VNRVVAVNIENSEYQKYQKQVRTFAVKMPETAPSPTQSNSARRRQGLRDKRRGGGLPRGIQTVRSQATAMAPAMGAEVSSCTTNRLRSRGHLSLGKISVEEKIYVTFELMM